MAIVAWLKQELVHNSLGALRRFPLTLGFAVITVILSIYQTEVNDNESEVYRYILTAALGVPLTFAIYLYSEREKFPHNSVLFFQTLGTILLLSYLWLFLPPKPTFSAAIRFALVAAMVHVWVSCAGYSAKTSIESFWQFNRSLFIRFAISAMFSGILYIGLTIALLSIDALLGIKLSNKRYMELFLLCAGIIHPWFFLAGVPKNLDSKAHNYPVALRVFAQYILIPLVAVYVVILYLYSLKVMINWEWPRYKATYLIGFFSAPGILANLLLYPLAATEWVKKFTRIFYMLLVPLVVMMLICVYRRVSEQGLTEMMVVAIAMGLWLIFISAFLLRTKGGNIRSIPMTLVVLLLFISFGPVSAPALGRSSQTEHLREILINGSVPDAKISLATHEKYKFGAEMYGKVIDKSRYLAEHFGAEALTPFIQGEAEDFIYEKHENGRMELRSGYQAHALFITHFINTEPDKKRQQVYYRFTAKPGLLSVKGFGSMLRYHEYRSEKPKIYATGPYKIAFDWQQNRLQVDYYDHSSSIDLAAIYTSLIDKYPTNAENLDTEKLAQNFNIGGSAGKIFFDRITGESSVREV